MAMSDLFAFDAEALRSNLMAKFVELDEARCCDEERYREEAAQSLERWLKSCEAVKESLAHLSALFADLDDDDEIVFEEDASPDEILGRLKKPPDILVNVVTFYCENFNDWCELIKTIGNPIYKSFEFMTVPMPTNYIANRFFVLSVGTLHEKEVLSMWFSLCSLENKCNLYGKARSAWARMVKVMSVRGEALQRQYKVEKSTDSASY
jgi:hypothetical protein